MNEALQSTCVAVFLAAWAVGIAAIVYTVVEMFACLWFAPFAFATGKVIIRITEPLLVRPAALESEGTTPHATFRRVSPERWLFRRWGA